MAEEEKDLNENLGEEYEYSEEELVEGEEDTSEKTDGEEDTSEKDDSKPQPDYKAKANAIYAKLKEERARRKELEAALNEYKKTEKKEK